MKLYHGTSRKALPGILEHGLKPRGTGKGNWKHTVDSNSNVVYLTNAYALYFAWTAAEPGEDMVVIEIDTVRLNPFKLVPDEDFLEQTSRKDNRDGLAPINKSMKYRTAWYRRRLPLFAQHWEDSVKGLGNCGYYGDIPADAITRYAILPGERGSELIFAGMDPMISLMNYYIVGNKYRNWIRWLFDDPLQGLENVEGSSDAIEAFRDSETYMRKVSRDGIEVRTVIPPQPYGT